MEKEHLTVGNTDPRSADVSMWGQTRECGYCISGYGSSLTRMVLCPQEAELVDPGTKKDGQSRGTQSASLPALVLPAFSA